MSRKAVAGIVTASILLLGVVYAVGGAQPSKTKTLTILYTSQARNQIRSCNCTKFRYGGYGRQDTFVAKVRQETPNTILIEGGDFATDRGPEQETFKAQTAIEAIGTIGYTAIVPGESEFQFGPETMRDFKAAGKTPIVLSNAVDESTSKPAFDKQYIVHKTANGVRVAIVGVLDPGLLSNDIPDILTTKKTATTLKATDPVEALRRLMPKVRKQADIILLVAHTSSENARKVLRRGLADIVLCTHVPRGIGVPLDEDKPVDAPAEKIGQSIFVESATQLGRGVGRLDITLDGKKIKSFTNRLFYLGRQYKESPEIVKLYDAYNAKVRESDARRQEQMKEKGRKMLAKLGLDASKFAREKPFASARECKSCHGEAYLIWEKSRHASAIESLRKTNQEFDPECVACHVTGSGERGGYVSFKETPELTNVQCEACHGAGTKHKTKPAIGYGAAGEDTCSGCHTQDIDPEFDYEKSWEKIKH